MVVLLVDVRDGAREERRTSYLSGQDCPGHPWRSRDKTITAVGLGSPEWNLPLAAAKVAQVGPSLWVGLPQIPKTMWRRRELAGVLGEEGRRKETAPLSSLNYWLGWQGRRRKADIVYLIKSKQQFAAASLPLAVCGALEQSRD